MRTGQSIHFLTIVTVVTNRGRVLGTILHLDLVIVKARQVRIYFQWNSGMKRSEENNITLSQFEARDSRYFIKLLGKQTPKLPYEKEKILEPSMMVR